MAAHALRVPGMRAAAALLVFAVMLAPATLRAAEAEASDPQEDEGAAAPTPAEIMEEIRVIGRRPGDPKALEPTREELLRQSIIRDWERNRALAGEQEWRRSLPKAQPLPGAPRIRWGYDPEEEMRMRQRTVVDDSPARPNGLPPTLLRITF